MEKQGMVACRWFVEKEGPGPKPGKFINLKRETLNYPDDKEKLVSYSPGDFE